MTFPSLIKIAQNRNFTRLKACPRQKTFSKSFTKKMAFHNIRLINNNYGRSLIRFETPFTISSSQFSFKALQCQTPCVQPVISRSLHPSLSSHSFHLLKQPLQSTHAYHKSTSLSRLHLSQKQLHLNLSLPSVGSIFTQQATPMTPPNRISLFNKSPSDSLFSEQTASFSDKLERLSFDIPRNLIALSFSRSSGPGGQNVNKLNTKVELRFNIDQAFWIPEEIRKRFAEQNATRISKTGDFILTSEKGRTQHGNIEDCFKKLEHLLMLSSVEEKERIPTEPPGWVYEKKKKDKIHRSEIKKSRRVDFRDF